MSSRWVSLALVSITSVLATDETYPDDAEDSSARYFAPDEWEPWLCHDYWYSDWCARDSSFFTAGFEYSFSWDGDLGPCAPCRCCKRPAKTVPTTSTTTAITENMTTTSAPSEDDAPIEVVNMSLAFPDGVMVVDLPPSAGDVFMVKPVASTNTTTRTRTTTPTTTSTRTSTTTTPFESYDMAIEGIPPGYLVGINGSVSNNVLTIQHQSGWSLFSDFGPGNDIDPTKMQLLQLLGKRMTFTVDLSSVGCACNLALYLIQSPARLDYDFNRGEQLDDQPPYYCDANQVGGQWCPELDIMEANNHAFQATPHACQPQKPGGEYESCDRSGCEENTRDIPDAYGPGESYTIDTTQPFDVSTDFVETFGVFSGLITTLKQGSRAVVLDHSNCHADYLMRLTDAMASGMSLRISYWGRNADTMAWMDAPPCGEEVCTGENAGDAVISNITVKSLPPPMGPAVWTFENPKDAEKYGEVVPKSFMTDHGLFVSLDNKGVVLFHKKPVYVKKIHLELPTTKEDAAHRDKSWFDIAKAVGLDCDNGGCEAVSFSAVGKRLRAGGARGSVSVIVWALIASGAVGLLVTLGLRSGYGCQSRSQMEGASFMRLLVASDEDR